ncbi:MAG: hypothetical protein K8T10_00855 [Candidatus Eremiobacteraeota bacterium]|nr:hypothetical protein [Candidatus Eremiobacteraeota bacterium]
MKNIGRILTILLVLVFITYAIAYAKLPDLPKQELWIKIVSLLVGLIIILSLSVLGLNRILYDVIGMEADTATKLSIIIGVILSFLWFLYIFGQIFDLIINIAVGVLIFIGILVYFLREKQPAGYDDGDTYNDNNDTYV